MAKRTENKKENGCYAIGKWFAWVVALLVTGCSPKVATEISPNIKNLPFSFPAIR